MGASHSSASPAFDANFVGLNDPYGLDTSRRRSKNAAILNSPSGGGRKKKMNISSAANTAKKKLMIRVAKHRAKKEGGGQTNNSSKVVPIWVRHLSYDYLAKAKGPVEFDDTENSEIHEGGIDLLGKNSNKGKTFTSSKDKNLEVGMNKKKIVSLSGVVSSSADFDFINNVSTFMLSDPVGDMVYVKVYGVSSFKIASSLFVPGNAVSVINPLCHIKPNSDDNNFGEKKESAVVQEVWVDSPSNVSGLVCDYHLPEHISCYDDENDSEEIITSVKALRWKELGDSFMTRSTQALPVAADSAMICYENAISAGGAATVSNLLTSRAEALIKIKEYAMAASDAGAAVRIDKMNYIANYHCIVALVNIGDNPSLSTAEQLRIKSIEEYPPPHSEMYEEMGKIDLKNESRNDSSTDSNKSALLQSILNCARTVVPITRVGAGISWHSLLEDAKIYEQTGDFPSVIVLLGQAIQAHLKASLVNIAETLSVRSKAALIGKDYKCAVQDSSASLVLSKLSAATWCWRILGLKGLRKVNEALSTCIVARKVIPSEEKVALETLNQIEKQLLDLQIPELAAASGSSSWESQELENNFPSSMSSLWAPSENKQDPHLFNDTGSPRSWTRENEENGDNDRNRAHFLDNDFGMPVSHFHEADQGPYLPEERTPRHGRIPENGGFGTPRSNYETIISTDDPYEGNTTDDPYQGEMISEEEEVPQSSSSVYTRRSVFSATHSEAEEIAEFHLDIPQNGVWPAGVDPISAEDFLRRSFVRSRNLPFNRIQLYESGAFKSSTNELIQRLGGSYPLGWHKECAYHQELGAILDVDVDMPELAPEGKLEEDNCIVTHQNFACHPHHDEQLEGDSTVVAIGFIDLGIFLKSHIAQNNGWQGCVRFCGYDKSEFNVAKSAVIWEIAKLARNSEHPNDHSSYLKFVKAIAQVWFSSAWSYETERIFHDATNEALRSGAEYSTDEKVVNVLLQWFQSPGISLEVARQVWMENRAEEKISNAGSLLDLNDRLAYLEYELTGNFAVSNENSLTGSTVMFEYIEGVDMRRSLESIFDCVDMETIMLKANKSHSTLVIAVEDSLLEGIENFVGGIIRHEIDITLYRYEDIEECLFSVQQVVPDVINWGNLPDSYTPRAFHNIARNCSTSGTRHVANSLNWSRFVFGTHITDYPDHEVQLANDVNESIRDVFSAALGMSDRIRLPIPVEPAAVITHELCARYYIEWVKFWIECAREFGPISMHEQMYDRGTYYYYTPNPLCSSFENAPTCGSSIVRFAWFYDDEY